MPKAADDAAKTKRKKYEDLGRMLENIYQTGYIDHKQTYKMSFLKGVAGGFGGVLGATVLIALLLWILSLFDQVPFLGPIFDNLERTVKTRQR